jgi:DegV family protein with EDD domain
MLVRVVTDSSCDLPEELADQLGIEIVPLTIRFGSEELVDRKELSATEFWRRLESSPALPETAAPSAGAFETAFRALVAEGADGILCINLSSKLSATMQSAQVAAKSMADTCPVVVVDSLTASMGVGNLVVSAAQQAAAGGALDDIVRDITSQRDRTKLFGALDTLEYLRKGGRIGAAQAMLGSMLSIKPVIEIRDGLVAEAGKVRTRSKALRTLAEHVGRQPVERLAVLHGSAPDLDELLDLVQPYVPRDEIIVGVVGPVIGTHSGPRVIGVTFQTTA